MTNNVYVNDKDFEKLNTFDVDVVKHLILHRSRIDSLQMTSSSFDINQELLALYFSLDEAILRCRFKSKQLNLLKLIYLGNTLQDICALNIGYKKSATYEMFNRMILNIIEAERVSHRRMYK